MNSRDPYSQAVRSLFAAPAHAGDLDDGLCAAVEAQGVRVELRGRARNGEIRALRFRARGCPHVIAAAEWLCAHYEARPVADLETASAARIIEAIDIPAGKTGRILVVEDVARQLAARLRGAA